MSVARMRSSSLVLLPRGRREQTTGNSASVVRWGTSTRRQHTATEEERLLSVSLFLHRVPFPSSSARSPDSRVGASQAHWSFTRSQGTGCTGGGDRRRSGTWSTSARGRPRWRITGTTRSRGRGAKDRRGTERGSLSS